MRRSYFTAFAGIMAALAAAAPAGAQQRSSTEWRTKPADSRFRAIAAKDAERNLATYARCVVQNRYERARSFVLSPYSSPEQAKAVARIVKTGGDVCLRGGFDEVRMKLSSNVMAGALAQALVLKDYPDLPAVVRSSQVAAEVESARAAQLHPEELFGRCIVQRDPASAYALFTSLAWTPDETGAIRSLGDDLANCLAAGSTIKINAMYVRNVSAVAAYRLAQQIQPRGAK